MNTMLNADQQAELAKFATDLATYADNIRALPALPADELLEALSLVGALTEEVGAQMTAMYLELA